MTAYRASDTESKIFCVDNFLRPEQCTAILGELAFAFWVPSGVTKYSLRRRLLTTQSPTRVSESTTEDWFTPRLLRTMRFINRRLSSLIPHFEDRREYWQATRYKAGGAFDYHYDSGPWSETPEGDREHTVMIYLNRPRSGGTTHFCKLGLQVVPKVGRLIVWRNLEDEKLDPQMLHAGTPIKAGRKAVLVTWVRQRNFREGRSR